jgi:hypothetical protein
MKLDPSKKCFKCGTEMSDKELMEGRMECYWCQSKEEEDDSKC